jgi:5-methylcytosine-specific restriction enzyme A
MSNEIPPSSRLTVINRAHDRCERCGVPAPNHHWHHRRSRSVKDRHTHCPCNGVNLCTTCHVWVHQNPFEARRYGWIISRHVEDPGTVPVQSAWGARLHTCAGEFATIQEQP